MPTLAQQDTPVAWQGTVLSVQPRIRLTRSFDERSHSYLGYSLQVEGAVGTRAGRFLVGIGKAAHEKHHFQAGDRVEGQSVPVPDPRAEPVEFYKTSKLGVVHAEEVEHSARPPWLGIAPPLEVYRQRGHRRLDPKTYDTKCSTCLWGCRMAVEIIVDHWKPDVKGYRFETFCYGPKSCALYRPGATRKVPGRKGMSYEEEDWVDNDATSQRGPDE